MTAFNELVVMHVNCYMAGYNAKDNEDLDRCLAFSAEKRVVVEECMTDDFILTADLFCIVPEPVAGWMMRENVDNIGMDTFEAEAQELYTISKNNVAGPLPTDSWVAVYRCRVEGGSSGYYDEPVESDFFWDFKGELDIDSAMVIPVKASA